MACAASAQAVAASVGDDVRPAFSVARHLLPHATCRCHHRSQRNVRPDRAGRCPGVVASHHSGWNHVPTRTRTRRAVRSRGPAAGVAPHTHGRSQRRKPTKGARSVGAHASNASTGSTRPASLERPFLGCRSARVCSQLRAVTSTASAYFFFEIATKGRPPAGLCSLPRGVSAGALPPRATAGQWGEMNPRHCAEDVDASRDRSGAAKSVSSSPRRTPRVAAATARQPRCGRRAGGCLRRRPPQYQLDWRPNTRRHAPTRPCAAAARTPAGGPSQSSS